MTSKKLSYVQEPAKSESGNRNVPLTPKTIGLPELLQAEAESEWIFLNTDGERLSYEAIRCLCRDAGIPHQVEHVFRHTFTTNCHHKGMDINILSRLLGHADTNITYNLYIHLYGDGFDEMYAALCQ